jgi:MFS family permease
MGYGRDPDSWRLADAAYSIAETGRYTVSRKPGYPVPEFSYAALHGVSYLWLPLVVLLCTLAGVLFALILRRLGSRDYLIGGLALAFTPTVFVMGKRYIVAGVLAGIAVGCRISSGVVIPAILLGLLTQRDESRHLKIKHALLFAASAVVAGVLAYIPGVSEYGIGLFDYVDASKNVVQVMKTASLRVWGSVGAVAALIALVWGGVVTVLRRRGQTTLEHRPSTSHVIIWLTAVCGFIVVFVRLPLEAAYLVTAVPFVLLGLAVFLPRALFLFFCIALIVSPFVEVDRSGVHRGLVLSDRSVRVVSMIKAKNILNAIEKLRARKLVVVAGTLTQQLKVMAREKDVYNRDTELVIIPWIDASQVTTFRATGSEVYYVPDRGIYPGGTAVKDLIEKGARMLVY